MKVNVQYAETHFAELASSAARGEEVEVALPDGPTLKLVVSNPALVPAKKNGKRILGAGRGDRINRKHLLGAGEGLITLPTDEEWAAMDKEIEDLMLNSPLFPEEK
jgi:antitoxin (DNA-binding transcriptional repressor) of toxin-antitoxin stability system